MPGGCDFDVDFCNWRNESKIDDFDWTRRKGKTPSTKTGPRKDRTGEGTRAWGPMGKRGGSINRSSAKHLSINRPEVCLYSWVGYYSDPCYIITYDFFQCGRSAYLKSLEGWGHETASVSSMALEHIRHLAGRLIYLLRVKKLTLHLHRLYYYLYCLIKTTYCDTTARTA